ncbi:MAG: potassium channel family protein [Oligoflexia bacterium]|nr:potassium channel family protein [Oligoflexia bacterium]
MNSERQGLFKPHHHISKLFISLLKAFMNPIIFYFAVVGNAIMFLSAYAFYYFEKDINAQVNNYWDALWWAMCTVSTVGYGDIVPITGLGRITGVILIIFGVIFFLGFIAMLISLMSTFIITEQRNTQ